MLQVVVKAPHKYSDTLRLVGDCYFIEDKFLPAMKHMGWVEPYDPAVHGGDVQPGAVETPAPPADAKKKSKARRGRK